MSYAQPIQFKAYLLFGTKANQQTTNTGSCFYFKAGRICVLHSHAHTHTHMHTHTHAHTFTHIHTHSHTHTHSLTCTHIHTFTDMHTHTHALTYTHTHSHAHTHTYTHTHMHTHILDIALRTNNSYKTQTNAGTTLCLVILKVHLISHISIKHAQLLLWLNKKYF